MHDDERSAAYSFVVDTDPTRAKSEWSHVYSAGWLNACPVELTGYGQRLSTNIFGA